MKFKDKVVIVTGAGSGIGRATAVQFAKEGAHVCIVCRNRDAGNSVKKEISEFGRNAMYVSADVSNAEQVNNMIHTVAETYGTVDILVNNAGIGISGEFEDFTEKEWDTVMNTNLKSQFLCCKGVIPLMKKNGKGVIINISSVLGRAYLPCNVAYSTSKAAIEGFTKALANETGKYNIRVNVVLPGSIDTPMLWDGVTDDELEAVGKEVAEAQPLGRFGYPEEIADAVLYLAGDEAGFITGSSLVVDGGLLTKLATTR